jgi:hypothetical protein
VGEEVSRKILFADSNQLTAFGTVSLGALIDALKPLENRDRFDVDDLGQPRWVQFDVGGLAPRGVSSYRGYYDHLAIEFTTSADSPAVTRLLEYLNAAVGEYFHGWKGGQFRMNRATPVWVSNPGECDSTAIVGLLVESCRVTILTEYVP